MSVSRRDLIAAAPVVWLATATPASIAADYVPRDARRAGVIERIAYRRQLLRALRLKRQDGEITRDEYRRYFRASFDRNFMDGFISEIEHAAKVAGDWVDDVTAWLRQLFAWMIENWDVVLKVILTLVIFI